MRYETLTCAEVNQLDSTGAVSLAAVLLAERATVTGAGKILRWSEFNENPDLLINELLARILVAKIPRETIDGKQWSELAIFSIENSAAYLATALAYELKDVLELTRPVRLIRARKVGAGSTGSPAMGESRFEVSVKPITAAGESRFLSTSVTHNQDLQSVQTVLVVDDFKATGSTLFGGVRLAQQMFGQGTNIVPMAALGKPEQGTEAFDCGPNVTPVLTALDVHFWAEAATGQALLKVNDKHQLVMEQASSRDFAEAQE